MPKSKSDNSSGESGPPSGPPAFLRVDEQYAEWGKQHPDLVYSASSDSVRGAINILRTGGSGAGQPGAGRPSGPPPGGPPPSMQAPDEIMQDLLKGMSQSWDDIRPYYVESGTAPIKFISGLWDDLNSYVNEKWDDVRIGFTELPQKMIFRGWFTLFPYALVVIQEMKKDRVELAPAPPAQQEVRRVYASLGLVVNDIARWLRQHGVRCQSNHPMGGLVNTPSLAAKAGLGWQGRSGILVTPEFGPRVRLAPVFIEHRIFEFTDNHDHDWIEKHCNTCRQCEKECSGQAIYSEKVINVDDVPGVGAIRTCIDMTKCLEPFRQTMGCMVCIKVCPFSQGDGAYARLKAAVNN